MPANLILTTKSAPICGSFELSLPLRVLLEGAETQKYQQKWGFVLKILQMVFKFAWKCVIIYL